MSPVRLVILGLLLYIGWRLLKDLGRRRESSDHSSPSGPEEIRDTLVEDPVCHTLIPKQQAIRMRRDKKTYYFCSEKCCDEFSRESGGEG